MPLAIHQHPYAQHRWYVLTLNQQKRWNYIKIARTRGPPIMKTENCLIKYFDHLHYLFLSTIII